MPKPLGSPKVGGRQKGTPNKVTKLAMSKAEELGVDPFEILLLFCKRDWAALGYDRATTTRVSKDGSTFEVDTIDARMQLDAAKEASQYLYPKRKAVELSSEENKPLNLSLSKETIKEFIQIARGKNVHEVSD